MRPNIADRRSVALGSILGASALVAIAISAVVAPVGSPIALPLGDGWSTTAGVVFFTLLTLAASVVTAESPAGFVLVAVSAPICAAAALGGPLAGAVVAFIGCTERRELARGFPWYGLLGNHGLLALAATAAGFAGSFVRANISSSVSDQALVGVAVAAAAGGVFILSMEILNGLVAAIRHRGSVASSVRGQLRSEIPEHAADIALAVLLATAYTAVAWWLTPVFLVPIVAVVIGARRYQTGWQADHDPLTGAILRRELDHRLATILAGASGAARRSGILVVDVDRFMDINDTLGHEAGDLVLREVVTRLTAGVRPADTVARTGGDEFVILLHGIGDESTLLARAGALGDAVALPMEIGEQRLRVGLSIGGVLVPREPADAAYVQSQADAAMYEAKRCGGGCRMSDTSTGERSTAAALLTGPRPTAGGEPGGTLSHGPAALPQETGSSPAPRPTYRPASRTGDARSAVLASVLGVIALISVLAAWGLFPVNPLIAMPIGDNGSTVAGILFFLVLTLAASVVTADSPTGFILVATAAPICAAAALGGPLAGALVALVGSTERRELARGFPWYGLVGNHAVCALAAAAGGVGAVAIRASVSSSIGDHTVVGVLAVGAAFALFTLVTGLGTGIQVAVRDRRPLAGSVRGVLEIAASEHTADVALAILLASMYTSGAWWLTAVFLVPIVAVVVGARRYELGWRGDHDPLTGAVLRRELDRRMATILAGASRSTSDAGILVIDVDKFKSINDALGHEAGDRVLREVAARLSAGVGPADTVSRTGGDEFVVLLPGIGDESKLSAQAEALAAAVGEPMEIGSASLRVRLSIGAVLVARDVVQANGVLSRADAAMYEAKQSGGGCRLSRLAASAN